MEDNEEPKPEEPQPEDTNEDEPAGATHQDLFPGGFGNFEVNMGLDKIDIGV